MYFKDREALDARLAHISIGVDEEFRFKCRGCGKCCKNREDIVLNPYDIYRISKNLYIQPKQLIKEKCTIQPDDDNGIPIIVVQPVGDNSVCPFLQSEKCSIHSFKPTVCAIYPLGRILEVTNYAEYIAGAEPDYKASFIKVDVNCGSLKHRHTVRSWFERWNIPVEDDFFIVWNKVITKTTIYFNHECFKAMPYAGELAFNEFIYRMYLSYNSDNDFKSQFEANIKEMETNLEKIRQAAVETIENNSI